MHLPPYLLAASLISCAALQRLVQAGEAGKVKLAADEPFIERGDREARGGIEELLKDLLPGNKVRVTHSIWANSPENKLESGREHELLMLLRNEWSQSITVFSVSPSFRHPENMDQIIRNVTSTRIFVEIPPGGEVTLAYHLKPEMDPVSVGLNIVVDYTDPEKQRWYRALGYSDVIYIVEGQRRFDVQTAIICGMTIFTIILAFPLFRNAFLSPKLKK